MITTLKPAPVSSRQFSYNHATKTFSAEISETAGFGRVYPDSVDEGLTIVSARTGAELVFVVTQEKRDREGDIQLWWLRSLEGSYLMCLWND